MLGAIGERSTSVIVDLLVLFGKRQVVIVVDAHLTVVANSHARTNLPQIVGFVHDLANFEPEESECARQNKRRNDCENEHGESFQSSVFSLCGP